MNEKRAGWDWVVFYVWDDEEAVEEMAVFGCVSVEEAVKDARASLTSVFAPDSSAAILGVVRKDALKSLPM